MGCDIHFLKEYREVDTNKWVSCDIWFRDDDGDLKPAYDSESPGRNYAAFGLIASVRTEYSYGLEAKGLPDNVSDVVQEEFDSWGGDAHSATYLTELELNQLALKLTLMSNLTNIEYSDVTRQHEYLQRILAKLNNVSSEFNLNEDTEKRMIMWFDN
jgi:hypothetical protein